LQVQRLSIYVVAAIWSFPATRQFLDRTMAQTIGAQAFGA